MILFSQSIGAGVLSSGGKPSRNAMSVIQSSHASLETMHASDGHVKLKSAVNPRAIHNIMLVYLMKGTMDGTQAAMDDVLAAKGNEIRSELRKVTADNLGRKPRLTQFYCELCSKYGVQTVPVGAKYSHAEDTPI